MKKIFFGFLFFIFSFSALLAEQVFAVEVDMSGNAIASGSAFSSILYPVGPDFDRLRMIIERTFSPQTSVSDLSQCIADGILCTDYRYTSLTEKTLKAIVAKTYNGNEVWYNHIFGGTRSSALSSDQGIGSETLTAVLSHVPKGGSIAPWITQVQIPGSEENIMIRVIDGVITRMKREKCEASMSPQDCYTDISNEFLPTESELFAESIFLYGKSVKIGDLSGEILYQRVPYAGSTEIAPYVYEGEVNRAFSGLIWSEFQSQFSTALPTIPSFTFQNIFQKIRQFRADPTEEKLREIEQKYLSDTSELNPGTQELLRGELRYYAMIFASRQPTYTLTLQNTIFTREEASERLHADDVRTALLYYSSLLGNNPNPLPCYSSETTPQCQEMETNAKGVISALALIKRAQGKYPENIEILRGGQVNLSQYMLDNFIENFHYETVGDEYRITYIGDIVDDTDSFWKQNTYEAILSGKTVSVPALFSRIPRESVFVYVKSPSELTQILETENDSFFQSSQDAGQYNFIQNFFHELLLLNHIDTYKGIKNPFAMVLADTNITDLHIVSIFSEADQSIFSKNDSYARVLSGGYLYVARSQEILDTYFSSLSHAGNMQSSDDLRAFWSEHSEEIHTAFGFVGDGFLEKITSLDTYVIEHRRHMLYQQLWDLQEHVWAYEDAFSKLPESLADVHDGVSTIYDTGFTLSGVYVFHPEIGTVQKRVFTTREVTSVTNIELQDYLQYRQIFREVQKNINPIGIIINQYGDGIELNIFMFPVPDGVGIFQKVKTLITGNTRDTLPISTDPDIQSGILGLFFGVDREKFYQALLDDTEISAYITRFQTWLGGENILQSLSGEFALVFGGADASVLEDFDMTGLDAHMIIGFQSEEKGKKFLETFFSHVLRDSISSTGVEISEIPLTEEYKGKTLYFYKDIPFIFTRVEPTYFFDSGYAYFGLSRTSIRNMIDKKTEESITDTTSFQTGTFLGMVLRGVYFREQIGEFASQMQILRQFIPESFFPYSFPSLISEYGREHITNQKLQLPEPRFSQDFGFVTLRGESGSLILSLSKEKVLNFSGTTLILWEKIRPKIPAHYFTTSGASLDALDTDTLDILSEIILSNNTNTKTSYSTDLFQNITAGINISDHELGVKIRIFGDSTPLVVKLPGININLYVILASFLFLVVISGGITIISRVQTGKKS